jgi:hypothetical protein
MRTPTSQPLALQPRPGFADGVGLDDGSFVSTPRVILSDGPAHSRASLGLKAAGIAAIGIALMSFVRRMSRR